MNQVYRNISLSPPGTAGAGHGGRGGNGDSGSVPGRSYGSLYQPLSHGSGSTLSSGGGVIRLAARDTVTLDGLVSVNGENAHQSTGGGSGGSLWISSKFFKGNGVVRASGGSGMFGTSGGGGGGRISVDFDNRTFSGKIEAHGGSGTKEAGGAGTIYLHNKILDYKQLIVDNKNVGSPLTDDITEEGYDGGRTWLTPEPNTVEMTFDEVDIRGQSQLAVLTSPAQSPIRWDVAGIFGDRSGILHVRPNQELKMTSDSQQQQPELLWGVNVYPRGDLKLSQDLVVDGIKMIVTGSLSGAQNVTVGNKGKLILRFVKVSIILRTVPTIVIAHTFCASPDTRISYR